MANNFTGNYTFSDNGVIIPDTAEILQTVQWEYREALGPDLSLEEATPQGRLIDTETQARSATISFNAQMANIMVNISMSSGAALDAWGANFDIPRNGAKSSRVLATVTGIPNTIIPANSEALDTNGIVWLNESEIIIGVTGSAEGYFICSQTGPVSLGVEELNTIVASSTLGLNGWETITNTSPAVLGNEKESDASYKLRILNGIFNGTALFGNYKSAVLKIDNVQDVFTYDNPYGTPLQLDNILIPAHSVFVCVDGGNAEEIGQALYSVKSAGAGWVGNTSVVVIDPVYNTTNTVIFNVPAGVSFVININATSLSNSNADLAQQIKTIIVNYFNGEYQGLDYKLPGIRALIDPFEIASLLKTQIQGVNFTSIKVGLVEVKPHAVCSIIKASITSGIRWASVNTETFGDNVSANGTYNFVYNDTNWLLNNESVTLSEYGITVTGDPITNDIVSVLYSTGELAQSPIQIFATEKASINPEDITVVLNG